LLNHHSRILTGGKQELYTENRSNTCKTEIWCPIREKERRLIVFFEQILKIYYRRVTFRLICIRAASFRGSLNICPGCDIEILVVVSFIFDPRPIIRRWPEQCVTLLVFLGFLHEIYEILFHFFDSPDWAGVRVRNPSNVQEIFHRVCRIVQQQRALARSLRSRCCNRIPQQHRSGPTRRVPGPSSARRRRSSGPAGGLGGRHRVNS